MKIDIPIDMIIESADEDFGEFAIEFLDALMSKGMHLEALEYIAEKDQTYFANLVSEIISTAGTKELLFNTMNLN